MEVKLALTSAAAIDTEALILLETEGSVRPDLRKALASSYASGEIKGKFLEFTLIHGVAGFQASRILVAGTGKPGKLTEAGMAKLAGAAVRFLKGKGLRNAAMALEGDFSSTGFVEAAARGAVTGNWEPDYLRTVREELPRPIEKTPLAAEAGPSLKLTADPKPAEKIDPKSSLTGQLYWQGEGLEGIHVVFVERGGKNRVYETTTAAEGRYSLPRFEAGHYTVLLNPKPTVSKHALPERYQTTTDSPLIYKLSPGEKHDFLLK